MHVRSSPISASPALLGVAVLLGGCGGEGDAPVAGPLPAIESEPWFADEASDRGITFTWSSGHNRRDFYLPEITAGGGALFDMDDDGDLDAYLVQAGSLHAAPADRAGNRLYRNRGDGTFEDVTDGSGADDRGYGAGAACGDYDNDGDVDIYVLNVGANALLRNDGDGRFTDVTIPSGTGDDRWSSSAAFVDYDADGDLDLYVANYVSWSAASEVDCYNALGAPDYCAPTVYHAPTLDVLYRNEGDGTFVDVTEPAGIIAAAGTGLGVACGDFTGDGAIDIFVANDAMPDRLWANRKNGTFRDVAFEMSCAIDTDGKAKAGMGVATADYDADGDLDLLVCNLRRESDSFYRNDGAFFTDVTRLAGLAHTSRQYTRFGMGLHDFDNDGNLDLYQVNGRVTTEADHPRPDDRFAEANLLYRGNADGVFERLAPAGGTAAPAIETSRGAAFGDVDNDGRIDVLIVNRDAPAALLRNVVPNAGHWIMFRVRETSGRDAHHAIVSLRSGDRVLRRSVQPDYSVFVSNDPRVHFGLGATESVTDVEVEWPDGERERFGTFPADRVVELRRGAGSGSESASQRTATRTPS